MTNTRPMSRPSCIRPDRSIAYQRYAWFAVLFGLATICAESTKGMGSSRTETWLMQLIGFFHTAVTGSTLEIVNHLLRKTGHFIGYGTLGVIFCRAWAAQLNRFAVLTWTSVRLRGAALGVLSVFLVACMDEFHQSFLPGRTATFSDVLLDTTGALLLNILFFCVLAARRRNLRQDLGTLRAMRIPSSEPRSFPAGLVA